MWSSSEVFEREILTEKYKKYRSAQIRCKQIDGEIKCLKDLRNKMVGTLYPHWIDEDIFKLELEAHNISSEALSEMITNIYGRKI